MSILPMMNADECRMQNAEFLNGEEWVIEFFIHNSAFRILHSDVARNPDCRLCDPPHGHRDQEATHASFECVRKDRG